MEAEDPCYNPSNQLSDIESQDWKVGEKPPVPEDPVTSSLRHMKLTYDSVSPEGWIKKQIVQAGDGRELVGGSFMKIHYRIYNFDKQDNLRKQPIYSTWDLTEIDEGTTAVPLEYCLMKGQVMEVLDTGVATMTVGETANFLARGPYAFGSFGLPGLVASNSPLFVQVVVLEGKEPTVMEKILHGIINKKSEANFDDIFGAALELKKLGNVEFNAGRWMTALKLYKKVFAWIDGNASTLPTDVKRFTDLSFDILYNVTACFHQLKRHEEVIHYCTLALESPPAELECSKEATMMGKLYYRMALAQMELENHSEAREAISKAMEFMPWDLDIVRLSLYEELRDKGEKQMKQLETMRKKIGTGGWFKK